MRLIVIPGANAPQTASDILRCDPIQSQVSTLKHAILYYSQRSSLILRRR
jgi:hypothetical protein